MVMTQRVRHSIRLTLTSRNALHLMPAAFVKHRGTTTTRPKRSRGRAKLRRNLLLATSDGISLLTAAVVIRGLLCRRGAHRSRVVRPCGCASPRLACGRVCFSLATEDAILLGAPALFQTSAHDIFLAPAHLLLLPLHLLLLHPHVLICPCYAAIVEPHILEPLPELTLVRGAPSNVGFATLTLLVIPSRCF